MPKGIVYILLFAYSISLLRPVLPYVSDFAAHVFWYSKHMATVHYENGKFHIHKDLNAASESSSPEKGSPAGSKHESVAEHLVFAHTLLIIPFPTQPDSNNSTPGIISIAQPIDLPPPRA